MRRSLSLSEILHNTNVVEESSRFSEIMTLLTNSSTSSPSDSRLRLPRKPKKHNSIIPSHFRPHVLASQRLLLWTTPHTLSFHDSIEQALPASHLTRLFEVMAYSLDESTREGYGSGLLRFTQYCDKLNVDERDRMPASEVLLASFAADAAGRVSSSALNNWFAGLHFWHTVNGAGWNGGDMLTQTRKGVQKLVPISSKRAKRPPVTIEHMYALKAGLDLSNSFDASVWAVACIAFWSCCR